MGVFCFEGLIVFEMFVMLLLFINCISLFWEINFKFNFRFEVFCLSFFCKVEE